MSIGQIDQDVDGLLQPFLDERRGPPKTEDSRRVDDVLARGAAMDKAGDLRSDREAQLAYEIDRRHA